MKCWYGFKLSQDCSEIWCWRRSVSVSLTFSTVRADTVFTHFTLFDILHISSWFSCDEFQAKAKMSILWCQIQPCIEKCLMVRWLGSECYPSVRSVLWSRLSKSKWLAFWDFLWLNCLWQLNSCSKISRKWHQNCSKSQNGSHPDRIGNNPAKIVPQPSSV